MLIGFSTNMCNPAFAMSTSMDFAARSRDPEVHTLSMAVADMCPTKKMSTAVKLKALTMHSRRHPNNDPIRLCSRLQHAFVIFESLTACPFLGIGPLLVLLNAFLQVAISCRP